MHGIGLAMKKPALRAGKGGETVTRVEASN